MKEMTAEQKIVRGHLLSWWPLFFLTTSFFAFAAPAHAQRDFVRSQPSPWMERSKVYTGGGKLDGPLVFAADISPTLYFWNRLETVDLTKGRRRFFTASGTPRVRLRMYDEDSEPVRTPSYMPTLDFRWHWAIPRITEETIPSGGTVRRLSGVTWLMGGLRLRHHSNGQDGCRFRADLEATDEDCPVGGALDEGLSQEDLNRDSGDFSTTYVAIAAGLRRTGIDDKLPGSSWEGLVELQWHPKDSFLPGSIDRHLARFYSNTRLRTAFSYSKRIHRARWLPNGFAEAALETEHSLTSVGDAMRELAGDGDFALHGFEWVLSYRLAGVGGWGPFVGGQHGQDFYNLAAIDEPIHVLMFGLVFGADKSSSYEFAPSGKSPFP